MSHKLGIIGYGGMAGWHHTCIEKYYEDLKVVAVYDIDEGRRNFAKDRGLTAFESADEFLASKLFDIVLVATPNNFHCDYVCRSLEAGYHVICEKPVAMNVEELDLMEATAKKCGKVFSVHQNRRWDEDFLTVKKCIDEGMVGKPYSIESRVHGQNGVVHGWREFKVAGGGMLYDWGVHLIDQLLTLRKEKIVSVYANLHSIRTPEVDDYFKLVMRYEDGVSAQIEVGTYTLIQMPRWYVYGDGGALVLEDWGNQGKIIHANDHTLNWEPVVVQTKAGPTRTMAPRPVETLSEIPLPKLELSLSWEIYYRNIMDTIDGKADLFVTIDGVRRTLKVIEAVFESDKTGGAVVTDI